MLNNMTYEPHRRDDYIFYLKVSDEKGNALLGAQVFVTPENKLLETAKGGKIKTELAKAQRSSHTNIERCRNQKTERCSTLSISSVNSTGNTTSYRCAWNLRGY